MLPARARLHLVTLSSFAIAQPLYDLIGRHAEFLVAHGAGRHTIAALVLVLSLGIPLIFIAVSEAARLLSPQAGAAVHRILIAALAALVAAGALRQFRPEIALPLTAGAGVAAGVAYSTAAFRTFLTVLSPAILIFPALFVLGTPVGRLLLPERAIQAKISLQGQPPIVLVVFDELDTLSLLDRNGNIDAEKFPNFAAFARRATWFPNAVASFPYTSFAIPAIATGVNGDSSRPMLPIAADYPDNLFTWLGQSYRLHVLEPITGLCPPALCIKGRETDARALAADVAVLYLHVVVPRALAERTLPSLAFAWRGFGTAAAGGKPPSPAGDWSFVNAFSQAAAEGRAELFRDFIRRIDGGSTLHFAHVLLPHDPYEYLPSGRRYAWRDAQTAGMTADMVWAGDRPLIETARARHHAQVGFVDTLVGELIAHLESQDLFDDALIVLMSDHGAAFEPGHSHRILNQANYRGLVAAPIFIKLPGQQTGGIDDRRASGLDILPTIAEVLGAAPPWKVDGRSTLAAEFPARPVLHFKGLGLPPLDAFDVRAEARAHALTSIEAPEQDALVGHPIATVDVSSRAAGMQVLSDSFRAFRAVPQDRAVVPALVEGRIERADAASGPLRLAIAVNGVIQAVTMTSAWYATPHYFATFVPEASIRAGANSLEVFAIEGAAPNLRLSRIGSDLADGLALVRGETGEALQLSDGRRIRLADDAIGFVDRVDEHADGITLHGWSVDQRAAAAIRTVVVFAGRISVAFAYPFSTRPDVAATMKLSPETRVTYSAKVTRADLARGPLRLFALTFANSATELQLSSEARHALARAAESAMQR